jgi:hypothetical protein
MNDDDAPIMIDDAAPNAYAEGLKKLRSATAFEVFEDSYKAQRLAALETEHVAMAALPAPEPRLTTAELAEFSPPDIYAEGLKALQERAARALARREL